jgi:hypothetical protein
LNLKQILDDFLDIDALRDQFSMRDLVPDRVIAHDLGPGAAVTGLLIEYECGAMLESQA